MAKETKKSTATQTESSKLSSLIPEKYKDTAIILVLALLIFIFFHEAIFGGSFWNASDNINPASFITYREEAKEFPLWQPYIFSGMPGMAAMMEAATRYWDITTYMVYGVAKVVKSLFDSDAARMAFWYAVLAAGMYILMRVHRHDRLIALYTAIATIFSTGILIWIMIGHNSKPLTFMMLPYIFIMIERLKQRMSLLNIALMVLVMHIMLEGGHVQMMFYTGCAVGIYLLLDIISSVMKKTNLPNVLRAVGVLAIAAGIAFSMSADKYLSVLEYTPYSTRGTAPITQKQGEGKGEEGKDYEYATMWSFSPDEMIDFFVPNYHGFGKVPYKGTLTGGKETRLMTYWGQKPFEDAAPYMGAIVMFLAMFGMLKYFKKDVFVRAMTITAFFALLLSFGYTFPMLYDLFFYHFPKFASFRAPSMALALMHVTIPVLAGYGIAGLVKLREEYSGYKSLSKEYKMPLTMFYAAIAVFIVSGIIFAGIFEQSYTQDVMNAKSLQGYGKQVVATLSAFIWENAVSDWTAIGIICAIGGLLVFAFTSRKISFMPFIGAMLVLLIIDLWRVGYRPMDVVDKQAEKEPFPKTDVINFVLQDKEASGERFRICDLANSTTNSDAYFLIENINGYHPAKLRIYQDMLDVCCEGSTSNVTSPFLWNMLNTKYIISSQDLGSQPLFRSQQTGAFVYYNSSYCKRAYFVDSVQVAEPMEILNHLKAGDFNPKTLAYLEKPLGSDIVPSGTFDAEMLALRIRQDSIMQTINPDLVDNQARASLEEAKDKFVPKAEIAEYENEYIKINSETHAQHLLVLSDIYFPACWKAYIDGKETEIYKTNYVLRSIVVPAGNHTIEFKYHSDKFETGRTLSTAANIILLLAFAGAIFMELRRKKAGNQS